MTFRRNSSLSSMTGLDRCEHNAMESPENANGHELEPGPSKPGKYSSVVGGKHSSPDGFYQSHESPRSASSSRPCSRPQSRHGSLPGSRIVSRTNSQESIIDLFDNILTLNGKFVSPKPKPFKEAKLHWRDKVRMNHAIWRAWHIQYVKKKQPVICQFTAPEPDERARLQADIIQGGNPNLPHPSNLGMHIQHYKNWRLYHKDVIKCSSLKKEDPEEDAIDLDKSHPPLSPMLAKNLANDDTLKDFSDTLFISRTTKKKFAAPTAKEIIRKVHISDIIQPSLMTLEPDLDEDFFMDTLESLTDLLTKTPTKDCGMSSMSMCNNLGSGLMRSDSFGHGHISSSDYSGMMSTETSYPIVVQASNKPRSVSFTDIPAQTSRQLFAANESQMQYDQYPMPMQQTNQMEGNFVGEMGVSEAEMIDDLLNSLSTTNYGFQTMHPINTAPVQVMANFSTEAQMVNTNTKMEPVSPIMHQCNSSVASIVHPSRSLPNAMTDRSGEELLASLNNWNKPPVSSSTGWDLNTMAMTRESGVAPVPMSIRVAETPPPPPYYQQENMDCDHSSASTYSQSLQINNRRERSKTVSPRQYRTLAPLPEAIGTALSAKLDTKDRGKQSPTSDREALTPVLTPGYLSTASSTASSPGGPDGTIPIEFEFQAPKTKKKKRSELDGKQREQRRRIQHLSSEHKRRNNIQSGLDEIQRIVCGSQSANDKTSQATLLQKTSDHIKSIQNDIQKKKAEMKELNEEIDHLNDQINDVQDELPDAGAPVVSTQNDHQLQAMFDKYVSESMCSNWKFWIFRMLIEPLFSSYLSSMSSVSFDNFEQALNEWVDQSCRLRNLRPMATKAVREVSKKTTILTKPQLLSKQVTDLVERETGSNHMES